MSEVGKRSGVNNYIVSDSVYNINLADLCNTIGVFTGFTVCLFDCRLDQAFKTFRRFQQQEVSYGYKKWIVIINVSTCRVN